MPANLPPVLLSCFKTLLTPLTEEERRCHQLAVAANFKAFNLSLVHVLNVSTACNALCLKPNAPDAGFIFMCDPLGTRATPEPSHALTASPSRTRRHVRRTVALARPGAAPP